MKNLILIWILLISNIVFAQTELSKVDSYKKILPAENARVKLEVVDRGRVESSEIISVNDLHIPPNRSINIIYDDKINYVKRNEVPVNLSPLETSKDWKVIPEILFSKIQGSDEIVSYRIFFTSVRHFKYNYENNLFSAGLDFVLVNAIDGGDVKNLEEPVYIEVRSQEIDEIQPREFSVGHLSLPSSEIELTEKNGLDSLEIKIITRSNLSGYGTYVHVEPALSINSSNKNIMGFGVEKLQLDVRTIGSSSSESVQVNFTAESGKFNPKNIVLKNNEQQSVQLKSGNKLGRIEINAIGRSSDSIDYDSNTLIINYTFPWLFIIFSIIGGVMGSLVRFRKEINIKKIFLGMLDGFTACILYFILKISIPQLGELDNLGFVVLGIGILGGLAKITMVFPFIGSLLQKSS